MAGELYKEEDRQKLVFKRSNMRKLFDSLEIGESIIVHKLGNTEEKNSRSRMMSGVIVYKDKMKVIFKLSPHENMTITINDLLSRYYKLVFRSRIDCIG